MFGEILIRTPAFFPFNPPPPPHSTSMNAKRRRSAPAGGGEALRPGKKPRRVADGEEMNALVLAFMRRKDAVTARPEARLAADCGVTRQRLHHLHKELKVVTIPLLVQWCNGRSLRASKVLDALETYVAHGGSIGHATFCQTCLP